MRIGIVMAGGSGERFWPLSTGTSPKQLLRLTHPVKNMLEEAVERLDGIVEEVFVSTTTKLKVAICQQSSIKEDHILAEPAKRNTLGALVWVVAELKARGFEDASVAIVTADHYIGDPEKFREAIEAALRFAVREKGIVTFGVQPTRPETGYGYIQIDSNAPFDLGSEVIGYRSLAFKEKPDGETALTYLQEGGFLWNSGMFFFTVADFSRELKRVQPEAAAIMEQLVLDLSGGDLEAAQSHFETLPNLSIDYAVMEKVDQLYVLPVDFPWDDVGAWDALERTGGLTEHKNSVRGEPILLDVSNSVVVQGDNGIHVTVLGVTDLIVVSTSDAVLVCHKSQAQRVRELARLVSDRLASK